MVSLKRGRTLSVAAAGGDETLEIRAASGALELRVKLTDDGVVVQLDGAHISLKAAESIDLECKNFNVNAHSDVHIQSAGDLTIRGAIVHIN